MRSETDFSTVMVRIVNKNSKGSAKSKTKQRRSLMALFSWLLASAAGESEAVSLRLREGVVLLLLVLAGYLAVSLHSYSRTDPGWSLVVSEATVINYGGRAGAWLADVLFSLLGAVAWLLPLVAIISGSRVYSQRYRLWQWQPALLLIRGCGLMLVLLSGAALAALHYHYWDGAFPASTGGILGSVVIAKSLPVFSVIGSTLLLLALLILGVSLYIDFSWFKLMDGAGYLTLLLLRQGRRLLRGLLHYAVCQLQRYRQRTAVQHTRPVVKQTQVAKQAAAKPVAAVPVVPVVPPLAADGLPKVGLLDQAAIGGAVVEPADLDRVSRLLELKLSDFGVTVQVVAAYPGPVITRYEVQPAPGVKASRISGLASDLARSLAVVSVRVVEVIPGKSVIGVEIPNDLRQTVYFSELVASSSFQAADSPLSLALGHDISGQAVVVDLARMPHLLVAGTTGSGKSVGINAMLLSLLFKASPDAVRLIMIDPKMLELSVYEGIPHLLSPVVTDMKEAANALRWCVAEMERRYQLMAALGVRNIAGFNDRVRQGRACGEPLADPLYQPVFGEEAPMLATLPFIVVVIDEFADMMMIVGKKVEELIARIAQKARAAGIHLVLATQRPSVDVITGLIKANVPTRISFQVSSKIDSRTIIDQGGAEQLLGHGDMLYLPPGTSVPIRVHGAFVSDDEVHRVVADWNRRGHPDYIEAILSGAGEGPGDGGSLDHDAEGDPLYDEAVAFVTESRKASISSVQRKLKIGYNRAARMIESMEMAGVISSAGTNGNREVIAPAPPKN